ncbi:type II secretion system GspH family protein [Rarobacter incanus]|uniref:type II secretion system GspH family protein n=1 Tax=Rarobacter incanus TaxID=153494 RepID=UPI001FEB2BDA
MLVVITIIGVLAGIAIPVFMHQRAKAMDAAIQADIKAAAVHVIALQTGDQPVTKQALIAAGLRTSPGVSVSIRNDSSGAYCILGSSSGGRPSSHDWVYWTNGGFASGQTSCPGDIVVSLP